MQQNIQNISNNTASVLVPDEFLCPITHDIMTDPVVDKNGQSYERKAITEWINTNGGIADSPINHNFKLTIKDLIPNRALKSQIEAFKQQNPIFHTTPFVQITPPTNQTNNLTINVELKKHQNHIFYAISPTSQIMRTPLHVVCVVDISGSMGSGVCVKSASGESEDNGLSRLDIVKHALSTIIKTLNEHDFITIITFSNQGEKIIEEKQMTNTNKEFILTEVNKLRPNGGTNLWDGIRCALDVIYRSTIIGCLNSLFVLTDGQPTVEPPRGHEHMIKSKLAMLGPKCIINTFGFGYDLNSLLLSNIAKIGNGFYSFIPDAGFVGTIFINALSNLLLSCVTHGAIVVHYENSTDQINSNEIFVFDSVRYEQTRTGVITHPIDKKIIKIDVVYINPLTQQLITNTYDYDDVIESDLNPSLFEILIRNKFCDVLYDAHVSGKTNMINFIKDIETISSDILTPLISGILSDAKGQGLEALSSDDAFNRWGKHYFRSLEMAHNKQICNNFKDPGVQCYSTPEFEKYRTMIDEIFEQIPPPTPSRNINNYRTYQTNQPQYNLTSMSSYNRADAGCFAETCTVVTPNGVKCVKDVLVGDYVYTGDDNKPFTKVKNVLRIHLNNNLVNMIKFNTGLILTEWHPVFVNLFTGYHITDDHIFTPIKNYNKSWTFPFNEWETYHIRDIKTLYEKVSYCGDSMYDFILEDVHTISVNNTICVTLGHNFQDDVVKHEYFGSDNVVHDIEKLSVDGYANITQEYFTRDPITKQINGIKVPTIYKKNKLEQHIEECYKKIKMV